MTEIPKTCPHCGSPKLRADYYEAVSQGIEFDDEGNYDYDGSLDSYDDGSTEDECIRCADCHEEVEVFGSFRLVPLDAVVVPRVDLAALLDYAQEDEERDFEGDGGEAGEAHIVHTIRRLREACGEEEPREDEDDEEDEEGMQRFIDENRAAIDEAILRALDRTADEFPLDDDERRQWIANDEGLYNWARSAGVRV